MKKLQSRATLKKYSKDELIDMIECLYHNEKVANESFENLSKILQDATKESRQFNDYMNSLVNKVLENK